MIFEDIGLRLDEQALKDAFQAAKEAGTLGKFFESRIACYFEISDDEGDGLLSQLVLPLSEIGLSARTLRCLTKDNVYGYVWQIAGKHDVEFLRMRNIGEQAALPDIKAALERLGIPRELLRWNKRLVARAQAQTDPAWNEEALYDALYQKLRRGRTEAESS